MQSYTDHAVKLQHHLDGSKAPPVSSSAPAPGLSIGEIASRSGVAVGTLRMWETRYGFPQPERLPSGHRRYSERDLEQIAEVLRSRRRGLPLGLAIERALNLAKAPSPSVYGALRERFPHLHPQLLAKPTLLRITHAIEDECCARAPRRLLFGCFQQERFYRAAQSRWRELGRTAEAAFVLADFARPRRPRDGPAEVPIGADDPLRREWVLVCEAPELPACLVAWERPPAAGEKRRFEVVWTVEPDVVREAARIVCDLAGRGDPELVAAVRERLAGRPVTASEEHLRAAVALATRMTSYVADGPG